MKKKLIIIGAGEFAEIANEYFSADSDYEVIAFSVENSFIKEKTLANKPIVPYEDIEKNYPPSDYYLFIAIPSSNLNRLRTRFYLDAKLKNYKFATYISSRAFIWKNVKIGENTFIFENNVIQPFVSIGNNCILWSGNHIGHRTVIHNNVFIASHAVISGYCIVHDNCFIGVNSTLVNNIKIARDCVIGAGALISKDTQEKEIYPGIISNVSSVNSHRYYKIKEY